MVGLDCRVMSLVHMRPLVGASIMKQTKNVNTYTTDLLVVCHTSYCMLSNYSSGFTQVVDHLGILVALDLALLRVERAITCSSHQSAVAYYAQSHTYHKHF